MPKFTVISLAQWIDHGSHKLNGDLILDGAITQAQRDELHAALADGSDFYPARVRKALRVENVDYRKGRVTAYIRDNADDMVTTWAPAWDEVTFDLTDTGVTIDAFIDAVRKTNEKLSTPAGSPK